MFLSVLITILHRFYVFPMSATSPAHLIHIYSTRMVKRIDSEAPHYVIFSIILFLPSHIQIHALLTTPFLDTPIPCSFLNPYPANVEKRANS
jgi:hypothetical protein